MTHPTDSGTRPYDQGGGGSWGYFAPVMATGIVAIGLRQRLPLLSAALLWLAAAEYVALLAVHVRRLLRAPGLLYRDLADPGRGFELFTFVAGTDVLGTGLVLGRHLAVGAALLACGTLAWVILGYAVPWAVAQGRPVRGEDPRGEDRRQVVARANGSWFVWVVASQSVAVLSAVLEPLVGHDGSWLALLAIVAWSVGLFCYGAVGMFVATRLLAHRIEPADLGPSYWVGMGGTAITVLAGGDLLRMTGAPELTSGRTLIAGMSLVFWAFGSWLIPILLAAGWWRHVIHRVPLRYEPAWWSIVFPVGMYGVASHTLGDVEHLPVVAVIGRDDAWIALAVWAVALVAAVHRLVRRASPRGRGG